MISTCITVLSQCHIYEANIPYMLMNESKGPLKQIPHFVHAHFSFLYPKKILLIIFNKKKVFTQFSLLLKKKTLEQYEVNEMHPVHSFT